MEKIAVPFECPNCHIRKNVRKLPATPQAKIKCPGCGEELKLVFDVNADPQTAIVTLLSGVETPASQLEAPRKETVYKAMPEGFGQVTPPSAPGPAVPPPYNPRPSDPGPQPSAAKGTQLLSNMSMPELREPVFVCRLGGRRRNKVEDRYRIGAGTVTIGRIDPVTLSDIMFDRDLEMSRRSVELSVIPTEYETVLKLRVLKATNPVTVGFHTLVEGETMAIHFGEVFTIGRTSIVVTNDPNLKKV